MTSNRPYVTVLKDLEKSRQALAADALRLQKQLVEIDQLIAGLKRRMSLSTEAEPANSNQNDGIVPVTEVAKRPTFAGMSMRWAILRLLGNHDRAMAVGEIADTLRDGGFPNPEKIRGNAAAVLSRLVSLDEAQNAGNQYTITDKGREALGKIRLPILEAAKEAEGAEESSEGA